MAVGDRKLFEQMLGMSSGYVLDLSDREFGELVLEATGIQIHADKYTEEGESKAKKLRSFWRQESDYLVGKLLLALLDYEVSSATHRSTEDSALADRCRQIATWLLTSNPVFIPLKEHARILDAKHLNEQIKRIEAAVETDPSLAIGTAKELIETCCKTILEDRGESLPGSPEIAELTKATLRSLKLVPEGIQQGARGADVIKRILKNLGAIGNGLAELRGLYGTGHGRHGSARGLTPRHARLAVGAAATLVVFLFETHQQGEQ